MVMRSSMPSAPARADELERDRLSQQPRLGDQRLAAMAKWLRPLSGVPDAGTRPVGRPDQGVSSSLRMRSWRS